jgi:hypothetical protein
MSIGPFAMFGAMVAVIILFAIGAVVGWKIILATQLKALKAEGNWRDATDTTNWVWKWEGGPAGRSTLGSPEAGGPLTKHGVVIRQPQTCFLSPLSTESETLIVTSRLASVLTQSADGFGRYLGRHLGDEIIAVANRCQVVPTTDPVFEERYLVATTNPIVTQCLNRDVREKLQRFYRRYRMTPIIVIHGGQLRISLQRAKASGHSLRDCIEIGGLLMESWNPRPGANQAGQRTTKAA